MEEGTFWISCCHANSKEVGFKVCFSVCAIVKGLKFVMNKGTI